MPDFLVCKSKNSNFLILKVDRGTLRIRGDK